MKVVEYCQTKPKKKSNFGQLIKEYNNGNLQPNFLNLKEIVQTSM